MAWKIKRVTNDELRQMFVNQTVPQGHYLGVEFPDPDLIHDEATGNWTFGEIDWDEFWAVVSGNGRMNRERVGHKVRVWEDNRWVREAATAHAEKQRARLAATA